MNDSKMFLDKWSAPIVPDEKVQVSARLDYDIHAKLHALKAVFPTRSVNSFINDILRESLSDIESGLGRRDEGGRELMQSELDNCDYGDRDQVSGITTSPNNAHLFHVAYRDIMLNGKDSEILKASKKTESDK